MPPIIKEINSLLVNLEAEDYSVVLDYIKLIAKNRKKQRALDSIAAMNEIHSLFNDDKGWQNEDEMIADMAAFRKSRIGV